MTKTTHDLIIVGSGPAGFAALEAAAEAGVRRLAIVEAERRLGGECPNWGCMPTKSLLQTVDVLEHCGRGAEFGVPNCGGRADFAAAKWRQEQVVKALTGGPRLVNYVRKLGAELIRGRAVFVGPDRIAVRGKEIPGREVRGQRRRRAVRAARSGAGSGAVPDRPGGLGPTHAPQVPAPHRRRPDRRGVRQDFLGLRHQMHGRRVRAACPAAGGP